MITCKQAAKTSYQIPTCVVNSELQLIKIANPDSSSLGVPLACAAVMIVAFLASHVH